MWRGTRQWREKNASIGWCISWFKFIHCHYAWTPAVSSHHPLESWQMIFSLSDLEQFAFPSIIVVIVPLKTIGYFSQPVPSIRSDLYEIISVSKPNKQNIRLWVNVTAVWAINMTTTWHDHVYVYLQHWIRCVCMSDSHLRLLKCAQLYWFQR